MKARSIFTLAAIAGDVLTQEVFEPLDFNVTEALIANGVDISALPDLANLTEKRSPFNPCAIACNSLKIIFSNQVLRSGSSEYDAFTNSYWLTQTASVNPYRVFKPAESLDVSTVVLLSRLTQCPFAIKGGGHAGFPGASSIEDGITISLEDMNEVTLSSDKKTAVIGPGNRWGAVNTKLAEHDLTVIGGRASDVGLGLVLGGGVSHHSNIYGFACDNVASFEVVTASGIILTLTPTKFPDLYWALRGGGNNFRRCNKVHPGDCSSRLDVGWYPHPPAIRLPKAHRCLCNNGREHRDGPESCSDSFLCGDGRLSSGTNSGYLSIPPVMQSTINRTLASDTDMLNAQMPAGHRYSFWAGTFKIDRDFMAWMQALHQKNVGPLPDQGSLTSQAFTVPTLKQMSKKGGNALGLNTADGPLFHVLLYMVWDDATKDDTLNKAASDFMEAAKAEAKNRGLYNRYIYMNYAGPYQNVVPSYGEESTAKLKRIARKYDPTAVFQELQPGGYKLEGAPYGETIYPLYFVNICEYKEAFYCPQAAVINHYETSSSQTQELQKHVINDLPHA